MADASAKFAVQLEDETSGAANAAAGALDQLERQILRDQKSLKDLEKVMAASKKATFDANTNYIGMAASIQKKRDSIAGAARDFHALGGSFGDASKHAKEGATAAKAIADGLHSLAKPANDVTAAVKATGHAAQEGGKDFDALARATKKIGLTAPDTISDFAEALSSLPGLFITATAGALAFAAAVGVGVVSAIGKLIGMAISSQEELQGVSQEVVNVAKNSPIARSEIAKLATDLEKTGLKGAALEDALDKAVKKKFGKDAEKSMMTMSVQLQKAKENAAMLFTGIHTNALLDALASMLKFLDDSTVEGQALKQLLESLLNPILDGIGKAGPSAKKFFQGMIIGALEAAIAFLLVKKRLEEIIGVKVDLKSVDWTTFGEAVAIAAVALGLVAAAIGVVAALVVGSVAAVAALAFAFGMLVAKVIEAVAAIPGALSSLNNYIISRVSAMIDAGLQFAQGLAQGIRQGLSEVIDAAAGLASGAVDAVKKTLKIASPSKLALDLGGNFGGALATGAESKSDDVRDAASGLATALVPPERGAALGGSGGRGGPAIHIENLMVAGVEGADDPSFPAKLAEAIEQALVLAGYAPEAA